MDELKTLTSALSDRYAVARAIGAGGMATVYLARDLKHDRDVAIKVVHPDLGATLGVDRFLAEIKTTAKLQHPHILPLLDSGSASGLLYYVMPLASGESLRERLTRERQLPIADAVRIASEVSSALDYAHRHGVVHRDIKPENILLHEGQAVVTDFGIALAVQDAGGTRMTHTGLSLGTPQYMSPEQAMGERAIDGRTDIYALGAVTYEMLTGDAPFTGSTVQAIVAKVMAERPTPPRTVRDTVPPSVEHAVLTALAKLPADRFATADAFAKALAGAHDPIMEAQTSPAAPARARAADRAAMRRRAWGIALGVMALAVAVGLDWRAWYRRATRTERVVRFVVAVADSERLVDMAPWPAAISPDGGTIVYAVGSGDEVTGLRALRTNQVDARTIPGTADASQVLFSPDGTWIAFGAGGKLRRARLDGSSPEVVGDVGYFSDTGGDWLPNDDILLGATGKFHGLSHVRASGGQLTEFARPDAKRGETEFWYPIGLDDGRTVALTVLHGAVTTGQLAIATVADGKVTPLGIPGIRPLALLDGALVYALLDGSVMAVPLDRRFQPTDRPVPVLDPVYASAGGNADVFISRAGALVTASGTRSSQLAWVGRDGRATPVLPEQHGYSHPRLSRDGRRIAVSITDGAKRDIWLADVASHTLSRLTNVGSAETPAWSADGSRVYYLAYGADGKPAIWSQVVDGSATPEHLADIVGDPLGFAVAADGRSLVVQVFDNAYHLMSVRLDSAGATGRFLPAIANATASTISPDDRWIAFQTDEAGTYEVTVSAYPSGGGRMQISSGGGALARWAIDGKTLFYFGGNSLIAAKLAIGASSVQVVSRDTVLRHVTLGEGAQYYSGFDVSPDGSRFLGLISERARLRLIAVPNWLPELREKLAAGRRR